jgi:aromatic-L-amino-acid decarboxylase
LIAIAPGNGHLVAGIERADSVALDPHKWLHAPFEVGCVLVRDAAAHRGTFAATPEYLVGTARGIAAAEWLYEYGLQTTRGFRALKVWMALMEHGVEKFGRLIDQNIAQARQFAGLVAADPLLRLAMPPAINIVCYRFDPGGLDPAACKALNIEILVTLQERGIAAVSDTTIAGAHWLRAAFNNHRTRRADIALLARETRRIGLELAGVAAPAAG